MNVQSLDKWWSTLKSAVFGSSSSLHLRSLVMVVDWCVSRLVRLICCRTILTASSPGRLLICRSLVIRFLVIPTTFAFRLSEVRRLLLDLDPYSRTDPLGMFSLFLKKTADVMAPRLSVVFRRFVHLGSFPACWKESNVTPIQKGPPSYSVAN